jgi:integrase/recombinase XerC
MAERGLSLDSVDRLSDLMRRFSSYAERGCGIGLASEVTRDIAEGFVRARSKKGAPPAVATMHFRRSAVKLEFLEGRQRGLVDHDPTLDLVLPPRSSLRARPLTDDEIELCHSFSVRTLTETRQPAAWALAEATARSAELARVRLQDLDLGSSLVWIAGSAKTDPRWGVLTKWGRDQVGHRLRALGDVDPATPLVCTTAKDGVSATSSASSAIATTLRRAGLGGEPDVRPTSVAAWAGARALARGVPIQEVAVMIGVRSLDRAAELIGLDWRRRPPEPPTRRPS